MRAVSLGYTWRDWLIIIIWILASVAAVVLVVTGHVPLNQPCLAGAEVIDICASH